MGNIAKLQSQIILLCYLFFEKLSLLQEDVLQNLFCTGHYYYFPHVFKESVTDSQCHSVLGSTVSGES